MTDEGFAPVGPPGSPTPEPTVVNGQVLLQSTLTDAADSKAAQQTVPQLRESFAAAQDELQAPVLLVATTVLSFGTALGVAALMFNHVFHFPGADPAV